MLVKETSTEHYFSVVGFCLLEVFYLFFFVLVLLIAKIVVAATSNFLKAYGSIDFIVLSLFNEMKLPQCAFLPHVCRYKSYLEIK